MAVLEKIGERGRNRTFNLLIKSQYTLPASFALLLYVSRLYEIILFRCAVKCAVDFSWARFCGNILS